MKFLTPRTDVRRNHDESLGHGLDAVITLIVFFGLGFGLDALFDTTPLFMIVLTVLGAIGLFARFYYQYEGRMAQHEDDRLAKLAGRSDAAAHRASISTSNENGHAS